MSLGTRSMVASVLALSLGFVRIASAQLVTFDTPGDLTTNFRQEDATLPYEERDGVGIGGTRGLAVTGTGDTSSALKNPPWSGLAFTAPGTTLTSSILFRTPVTIGVGGDERIVEVNFASDQGAAVTGAHTGLGGKLEFTADQETNVLIRFRQNNADVAGSASATNFQPLPETWYKATFSMTNTGGAEVPLSMVVDQYNATGTAVVTPGVLSHSFTVASSALTTDPDVFGAFRLRNGPRLVGALDQYEAAVVPEPGAVSIAALAGLALLARRRSARA